MKRVKRQTRRVLCSIDYLGVEMVTLAQSMIDYGFDSPLADALNSGQDPHCRIGARFVGVSYGEFFAKYKAKDPFYGDIRQAMKPTNFGYGGRMGAAKWTMTQRKAAMSTFGPDGREYKGLRVCLLLKRAEVCGAVKLTEWKRRPCKPVCKVCCEIAEEFRNVFIDEWRMKPYFDRAAIVDKTNGGDGEATVMPLGRVRGGCTGNQAANQPFQGRGSDMIKHAHWEVTKECYLDTTSPMYGARISVVAHDELISGLSEPTAHEAAHRMRDVMVEAGQLFVPDVRLSAEPALMPRWFKGAEPLYDSAKRLIPWFPGAKGFDLKGNVVEVRA